MKVRDWLKKRLADAENKPDSALFLSAFNELCNLELAATGEQELVCNPKKSKKGK